MKKNILGLILTVGLVTVPTQIKSFDDFAQVETEFVREAKEGVTLGFNVLRAIGTVAKDVATELLTETTHDVVVDTTAETIANATAKVASDVTSDVVTEMTKTIASEVTTDVTKEASRSFSELLYSPEVKFAGIAAAAIVGVYSMVKVAEIAAPPIKSAWSGTKKAVTNTINSVSSIWNLTTNETKKIAFGTLVGIAVGAYGKQITNVQLPEIQLPFVK